MTFCDEIVGEIAPKDNTFVPTLDGVDTQAAAIDGNELKIQYRAVVDGIAAVGPALFGIVVELDSTLTKHYIVRIF